MAEQRPLQPDSDPIRKQALQDEWEKESRQTIDESELRGEAEWVKAIGDENESPERIEQNLQEYGWDLLGEDDFVSNPTTESDMPTWLEDDYDDTVDGHQANEAD